MPPPSQSTTDRPETGCSRLAPSPTGALHLGNARSFLINWALARQRGWRLHMRIEDLDGPRVKPGARDATLEILRWLGIDFDGPVTEQQSDLAPYREAIRHLATRGLVYPCRCTRREIEAALSAPHREAPDHRYPGTCRPAPGAIPPGPPDLAARGKSIRRPEIERRRRRSFALKIASQGGRSSRLKPEDFCHGLLDGQPGAFAWRVRVPDDPVRFEDQWAGPCTFNVQAEVGDFVVATKAGLPSYQLAVTVDDARQGVTDVVRGDDLLPSTARQLWLYTLLELPAPRRWWHAPLVVGPDGRRLAKRHGDTRIAHYREAGVPPERIIGLLACYCGVTAYPAPMEARIFLERFDPTSLPREPAVFTESDHHWLLS